MVRAVMQGYDESDMNGLFQATRKKFRSTLIFIACIAVDMLIFFGLFALPYFFDIKINSGVRRPFKWIIAGVLAFGIFQIAGDSKAKLKTYPRTFKEGFVFTCFSNTDFYYSAVHKDAVYTPGLSDSIAGLIEKTTEPHYYHELKQIIEDRERFYLFPKNKGLLPLIIRKESISEGNTDELREIFSMQLKDDFKTLEIKPPQEDVW